MEIMPDHVCLLMEVDPQFGIHRAVKAIKGKTSKYGTGSVQNAGHLLTEILTLQSISSMKECDCWHDIIISVGWDTPKLTLGETM